MKQENVPQDPGALSRVTKEVCYATDSSGKYTTTLSKGWDVKITALNTAWDEIDDRINIAKKRVMGNEASPLLYHMEKALMDVKILAGYTGFWQWQVKLHLRPANFKKLSSQKMERYAAVFNISVAELKTLPPDGA